MKKRLDKLCLVIDNLGSGGAQRQLCMLARELSLVGWQVTIFTYVNDEHMLHTLSGTNVSYVCVDKSEPKFFVRAKEFFGTFENGIIIAFMERPAFLVFLMSFFVKFKRIIVSERNITIDKYFSAFVFRCLVYWRFSFIASNTFRQSNWLAMALPFYKRNIRTIWNGVDLPGENTYLHLGSNNFICVGRVGRQKNPWLILHLLEKYNSELSDVRFDWYGAEDVWSIGLRDELNEYSLKNGLNARFSPPTKDVDSIYRKSNFLVLTSLYEGMPNVVLEAMARGLVVICPKIADLEILIEDKINGILYDVNSLDSFFGAINFARQLDKFTIHTIGLAAVGSVSKACSPREMALKYESLIVD